MNYSSQCLHTICTMYTLHISCTYIYVKAVSCTINNAFLTQFTQIQTQPSTSRISPSLRPRQTWSTLWWQRRSLPWWLAAPGPLWLFSWSRPDSCPESHDALPSWMHPWITKEKLSSQRRPNTFTCARCGASQRTLAARFIRSETQQESRMTVLWLRKAVEVANHTKFWWTG